MLAGVAGLAGTGWLVTRQRYVDDEVPGWSSTGQRDDVLEVAGAEPPARAPVGPPRDGSPPGSRVTGVRPAGAAVRPDRAPCGRTGHGGGPGPSTSSSSRSSPSPAAAGLEALSVPSPALFAGLAVGLVRALSLPRRIAVPRPALTGAHVVIGVMVGTLVQLDTLTAIARDWVPVVLVTASTLVLSLAAGQLMALRRGITPVTGAFAMIAGGATGITVMARDLGADERMVAVLQYLRVLVIVLAMPVVALLVYGADPGSGAAAAAGGGPGWWAELGFTIGCGLVGTLLARLLRIPVAPLLGPMLVAAALDLGGLSAGAGVPVPLESLAFLLVGLQVGVNFTRASLRLVGRALPLALLVIVVLGVACAGLGPCSPAPPASARWTGTSPPPRAG